MPLGDILGGNRSDNHLDAPATPPSSEQNREEERKKETEQAKAMAWIAIGMTIVIMGIVIFLIFAIALVASEAISLAALGWLILLITVFLVIWELLAGVHSIPTQEAWIIEARNIFWKVQTESPLILPLPLMITKIAQRISLKEITDDGLFKEEQLELKDTKISVKATMTYRIKNPFRAFYNVEPGAGQKWGETLLKLVRGTAQDALQTCVIEEGPNNEPYDTDTIVKLRGANLAERIFKSQTDAHKKLYTGFRDNLERWGIEVVTLIFKDFARSEDDEKERREVYKQRKARTRAEIGIDIGRMEGKAAAEKIGAASWELAKDYAGIRKANEDLSEADIKAIAVFVPMARGDYLESLSVEAVKPTDKTVITEGSSIGRTVGRDAIREAIRREMSESSKKSERKEKEKEKED